MARRKRGTPEQQARRALISELLSAANVQSMDDIQNLIWHIDLGDLRLPMMILFFCNGTLDGWIQISMLIENHLIEILSLGNATTNHPDDKPVP